MKYLRYALYSFFPGLVFLAIYAVPGFRYTVVIDPGHGGLSLNPVDVHGDKYDPVEKKYLTAYQQGASYKKLHESELAWDIGIMVKDYLDLTKTSAGRKKFREILQKYNPEATEPKEAIRVILSRDKGYPIDSFSRYEGKTDRDSGIITPATDFLIFQTEKQGTGNPG
jgi:hypothetical protein